MPLDWLRNWASRAKRDVAEGPTGTMAERRAGLKTLAEQIAALHAALAERFLAEGFAD